MSAIAAPRTRISPRINRADRWVSRAAAATVAGLAGIAGAISYSHMRALAAAHGDTGWHAHAFPLSVDGVEIVASLVLLADRRSGRRSGWLPWTALTIGTAASLAANIATAGTDTISRVIAGWPALACSSRSSSCPASWNTGQPGTVPPLPSRTRPPPPGPLPGTRIPDEPPGPPRSVREPGRQRVGHRAEDRPCPADDQPARTSPGCHCRHCRDLARRPRRARRPAPARPAAHPRRPRRRPAPSRPPCPQRTPYPAPASTAQRSSHHL